MNKVSVIGYYTSQFGELWNKSFYDLIEEAINGVLINSKIDIGQIEAIFFANMLAGVLENNLHSTSKISEIINSNIPVFRVEAACASGGTAFHLASEYIKAGKIKTAMVLGAEKMTDYSPEEVTSALAAASSGEEQEAGLTFAGLYALIAQHYLHTYKYSEENLAHVSVKNHFHGSLNDKAQFRKKITIEQVLKSPYVAYPLKVLDSSPISDGASSLILTSDKSVIKKTAAIRVLSSNIATDSISLSKRKRIDEITAARIASNLSFSEAKISRKDIHVAEVHDCFSIAEILAMEDIGFWEKGEGGALIKEMATMYGSDNYPIINTSGGLKAAGHPVGATGIKQIGELYLQLTNKAGQRQVKNASYGLSHNVGGSGGTAVITILGA